MKKCNILIPIGCRSDKPISKPIIKRLKENKLFDIQTRNWGLIAGSFDKAYEDMKIINFLYGDIDLVFCTADRIEMTACACYAFHNHIPIAHYLGGVLNSPLTCLDDINRHAISLMSEIQFVESKRAMLNIEMLFKAIKKESNCHVVGSTYLENLEVDESLVPEYEYDLVLINPTTLIREPTFKFKKERRCIIIGPNPDPNPYIYGWGDATIYNNLPRPQFFGLLKNCKRFITNSSSAFYEAPRFLDQANIIHIGDRNKNRTTDYYDIGRFNLENGKASELIVQNLEEWWKEKCKK